MSCTSLVCGAGGGATFGLFLRAAMTVGVGTLVGHLSCSISQCSALAWGQPPVPIDVHPWLPRGPYHGAGPSLGPEVRLTQLTGPWGECCGPPLAFLLFGGTPSLSQVTPQGREDVIGNPCHSSQPLGQQTRWAP